MGSSPHARRAHGIGTVPVCVIGIIPACAGSTICPMRIPAVMRDHPRMRGEHGHARRLMYASLGSSPHARGAPLKNVLVIVAVGIIPACAGSTRPAPSGCWRCRDHPRMRGEHWYDGAREHDLVGSSPHARGALFTCIKSPFKRGIIPTCAGSTCRTVYG